MCSSDLAKKSQEELVKVQLDIVNRLNERGNMNTHASQDMPDKHDSDEEQKRVADACPVVHACKDAQIRANLTELKKMQPSLAPLTVAISNSRVVSASPMGVDAAAFYLITPPIAPGIEKSEMAVASVKFTIQSHDQGWTTGQPGTSSSLPSKRQVEYIPQGPMWAHRLGSRQLLFATAIQI